MPSEDIETLYPKELSELVSRINSYISDLVEKEEQKIMKALKKVKGMIDVVKERNKIQERLQKGVAQDEELKTIARRADELIKSTALSRNLQ